MFQLIDQKTKVASIWGLALAPVVAFVEKYLFNDWQFLSFLVIIVALDTALSLIKHWRANSLSSTGFAKLFTKMIVYMSLLILTHLMTHYTVQGQPQTWLSWIDYGMYGSIMVREAISILENLAFISPDLVPKWIIKRLYKIAKDQDNGNFTQQNEEQQ